MFKRYKANIKEPYIEIENNFPHHEITMGVMFGVIAGSILYLGQYLFGFKISCFNGLDESIFSSVLNLSESSLLFYVLRKRLGQLFLLILLSMLFSYGFSAATFAAIWGICYGMLQCNLYMHYDYLGTIFGFFCFFPHGILYGMALGFMVRYFERDTKWRRKANGNINLVQYFIKFFVIFILFFAGVYWEIHFQKNILKFFSNM